MSKITIDIDTLRSYANTMNGHISQYESLNTRLESLSASVTSTWKGDSCQVYGDRMAQYVTRAKSLVEIMNQFKQYAEDTANKFETADSECAARIRQSF